MKIVPTDDRLFRAAFDGTAEPLLLVDDEGTCLEANGSATELLTPDGDGPEEGPIAGFVSPEADFGTTWDAFLERGTLDGRFDLAERYGAAGVSIAGVTDVFPGVHLLAIREPSDGEGERVGLLEFVRVLSGLFESSPRGVVVVDAGGNVVDANRQAKRILGLERTGPADRTDDGGTRWLTVPETDAVESEAGSPVEAAVEAGSAVFGVEAGIERPGGGPIWLSLDAIPVRDGGGRIETVVAAVDDITDRTEYRRLLDRQNERLETYSATVSHDLRSPLSVASGWLDVATEQAPAEQLPKVEDALDRMGKLITELRTLGRCAQTVERMAEHDVEGAARTAWRGVETGDATLDIDPELETVRTDRKRLLELFERLFENAVQHAGSGSTVRVGPLADGSGFYVEDDGPGIPKPDRKKAFEFGYTTAGSRVGSGLAIVDAIADAHGWERRLLAAEPVGARFEFRPRWHPDRNGAARQFPE